MELVTHASDLIQRSSTNAIVKHSVL